MIRAIELILMIQNMGYPSLYYDEDNKEWVATTEWLVGPWAGRQFTGPNLAVAMEKQIEYLHEQEGHDSMVGDMLRKVGWPHLDRLYDYFALELRPGAEESDG